MMPFITWIYVASITVHLVYCSTSCPSTPPEDIRPACPGSQLQTNSSREACQKYNSSCCWTDNGNNEKPNCYYVPDLKHTVYNAALGKPTHQSSTYYDYISRNAVDGCTCCRNTNCCASTRTSNSAWLSVDLQGNMLIVSVTVFIAEVTNLDMELRILVSNSPDPTNATEKIKCTNELQKISSPEPKKIVCKENIYGRYVIIQKTKNSTPGYLTLCEVQIETSGRYNAAFGKSAWQSTTLFYEWFSTKIDDRAFKNVDGSLYNNYWDGYCSHTVSYTDRNPWWSVDLGQVLTVYSVTLVNRGDSDRRLKNLTVSVSNTTHWPTLMICGRHQQQIPKGAAQNIACSEPASARFVIVQKIGDHELNMCEVIVETACPDGRYGPNCWQPCYHCRNNLPCDKVTGHCPGGLCLEGFQGDRCDKACHHGTYGQNCVYNCSGNCKDKVVCLKDTGHCPDQLCEPGYMGYKCDRACNPGTYGEKCINNCSGNCKDGIVCLPETGLCPNQLCQPGYMGPKCDKECSPGSFGQNCSQLCSGNCQNNDTCNSVDGSCQSCAEGYRGSRCYLKSGNIQNQIPVIAGAVVAVIAVVIILVVVLVVLLFRKRMLYKQDRNVTVHENKSNILPNSDIITTNIPMHSLQPEGNGKAQIINGTDSPPITDNNANFEVMNNEQLYQNVSAEETPASKTLVEVANFQAYVKQMKQKNVFQHEYESIPVSVFTVEYSNLSKLKVKNRYKNVLPYDNNRVVLQKIEDEPLSDYINASYIEDYEGKKSYIAALGTTEYTTSDFWRMIWEVNIKVIVMLTKLMEESKMKCTKYWPDGSDTLITDTDIAIKQKGRKSNKHYITRTFSVSKSGTTREVIQYHFLEWPDKGVPENTAGLHPIIQEIKVHRAKQNTPVLVHCSAGVGRTGTVIALDILSEQAKSEDAVDIYKCVYRLREQRISMVQTLAQYKFIHDYLNEMFSIGVPAITVSELEKVNGTDNKKIEKQYQFLEDIKPVFSSSELDFGKRDNKDKNRDNSVIPADSDRVKLASSPETYFNAVYIKGLNKSLEFCATQVPMRNTVEDFWKFIWEEKCTSVVCLENDPEYSEWLLTEQQNNICCDQYCITTDDVTADDLIKLYDVTMQLPDLYYNVVSADSNNEKDSHKLKVFIMPEDWSKTSVSERDTKELIHLYTIVQDWQKQCGDNIITVMCLNGAKETGIYIAASRLLEEACTDREVDVFNTVREIRTKRPQMIPTQEQYIYLHTVVQHYMSEFAEYVNI